MRQIVLDTETTGLNFSEGHRIIEIGCIELVNRKFTGKRFHQFINPEREIDEGAAAVHGITQQSLNDKPIFAQIVHDFMNFISGAELIIHNAPFDVGFINHELSLLGSKKWKSLAQYCHILDTLILARQLHIGQRNNLDALCKRYGIDNSQRELHGALMDAHLLGQVYLAMTGGQGSLFDELPSTEVAADTLQMQTTQLSHGRKLRVLKANADELLEHSEQLEKIAKKSECVWLGS